MPIRSVSPVCLYAFYVGFFICLYVCIVGLCVDSMIHDQAFN